MRLNLFGSFFYFFVFLCLCALEASLLIVANRANFALLAAEGEAFEL